MEKLDFLINYVEIWYFIQILFLNSVKNIKIDVYFT